MDSDMMILLGIIGAGIWFFNRNSSSMKDTTVVVTKQKTYVNGVEQEITRTTTVTNRGYALNNQSKEQMIRSQAPHPFFIATEENHNAYLTHKDNENRHLLIDRKSIIDAEQYRVKQASIESHEAHSIQVKYCPNCKRNQPISEFYTSQKHNDGLSKWCATCLRGLNYSRRKRK